MRGTDLETRALLLVSEREQAPRRVVSVNVDDDERQHNAERESKQIVRVSSIRRGNGESCCGKNRWEGSSSNVKPARRLKYHLATCGFLNKVRDEHAPLLRGPAESYSCQLVSAPTE